MVDNVLCNVLNDEKIHRLISCANCCRHMTIQFLPTQMGLLKIDGHMTFDGEQSTAQLTGSRIHEKFEPLSKLQEKQTLNESYAFAFEIDNCGIKNTPKFA